MGFAPGMQVGKYELGKKLGEGGFGLVMIARDTQLDREVALKFMHAEHTANPDILRRFLQEARSAAKITHPGIVTVFECGQVSGTKTSDDGVAYIAMELLHGESLSDRLQREGRLEIDAAIEIVAQVASALDAAHRTGVVHRDLKPDNIFLMTDPAMPRGERVKVLDFGIAKLAQATGSSVQTHSMMVFGTPRYMSPEQCKSAANIDHRSDIYALGCILFELVCGVPPFVGETGELIAKHQLVEPPIARALFSDVPETLDQLIASMLAKAPDDRPQTMAAVHRALQQDSGLRSGVAPTALLGVAPTMLPDPRSGSSRRHASNPSSRPRAAAAPSPTTISQASGVWEDKVAPRRKAGLILGGVAVAALGVGTIWFALRDPAQPASTAAAPPAVAPTPKRDVELKLTSTPKAEVFTIDGRLLGETPYAQKRSPEEGRVVLVLRAEGYEDLRVTAPADRDDEQALKLVAVKSMPAGSASTKIVPNAVRPRPPTKLGSAAPPVGGGSASKPPDPKPPDPPGMGGRL